jgi:hypothetical protein
MFKISKTVDLSGNVNKHELVFYLKNKKGKMCGRMYLFNTKAVKEIISGEAKVNYVILVNLKKHRLNYFKEKGD